MEPVCFLCQEDEADIGHKTISCPKQICKRCQQRGHFRMNCQRQDKNAKKNKKEKRLCSSCPWGIQRKLCPLDHDPGVPQFKDFYRNGRNTRFWLVALRGKDFGIKTLTIAHQTQSIFIKL